MRTAYFDCFSGASGDMIVGALIDAGASLDQLRRDLASLGVAGFAIDATRINKQGFSATQFQVRVEQAKQPHRHLRDILALIDSSALSAGVQARATAVFRRLAQAEARVHGCAPEKVHFHEVGAVDSIVDVVSAVAVLEQLGVGRVMCSPVCVGSGTVRTDHGELPVPAPATALLLTGVPLAACDETGELTTPTGAAILTELADTFGPLPAMTPDAVGYGAGRREGKLRPNVLRIILGHEGGDAQSDEVVVLETNLDDAPGETVGYCLERLLEAGALDAYGVPIYMKKSRPGWLLTVLSAPHDADRLEAILFAETTTFGVRRHAMRRAKLAREHVEVQTPFGAVRVKVGVRGGELLTTSPEYEDCRKLARQCGRPLREVLEAARRAWEQSRSQRPPD